MKSLDESVAESLDGSQNLELLPYLPYILQDMTDLGTSPDLAAGMLMRFDFPADTKALDLGCGKGAVSVRLARQFGFKVKGIDGVNEFISSANELALNNGVLDKCSFEAGDIREKISVEKDYNLVILGAIGKVFGDMLTTLNIVGKCLKPGGCVLLDDGYIDDSDDSGYYKANSKSQFYEHISNANFAILAEQIIDSSELAEQNKNVYSSIETRVYELAGKYPEKKELFLGYLDAQKQENDNIENKLVCGMWLLKKVN